MIIAKLLNHRVEFIAQTQKYYWVTLSKLKIYYVLVSLCLYAKYLKHELYLQLRKLGLLCWLFSFVKHVLALVRFGGANRG